MALWDLFVDLVSAALFALAPLVGDSLGGAIVALSAIVRLVLLPVQLRAARRSRAMRDAAPHVLAGIKQIRTRHAEQQGAFDRAAFDRETRQLMDRHAYAYGGSPAGELGGLLATVLVQLPILAAVYTVFSRGLGAGRRFLWVADLTRPDALVVALVLALSAAGTLVAVSDPAADGSRATTLVLMVVMMTVVGLVLSRLAAGFGLYLAASGAVSLLQAVILRREARPAAPAA